MVLTVNNHIPDLDALKALGPTDEPEPDPAEESPDVPLPDTEDEQADETPKTDAVPD